MTVKHGPLESSQAYSFPPSRNTSYDDPCWLCNEIENQFDMTVVNFDSGGHFECCDDCFDKMLKKRKLYLDDGMWFYKGGL